MPLFDKNLDDKRNFQSALGEGLKGLGLGLLSGQRFAPSLALGFKGYDTQKQNINSFNTYKPYFDQMGIDTTALNPAMGGSGFGEMSTTRLIDLQDTLENREFNRMYKTQYLNYLNNKNDTKNETQQTTLADLMSYSPGLANRYQVMVDPMGKYDFSGGKNRTFLQNSLMNMGVDINKTMPLALGQSLLQNKDNIGLTKQDLMQKDYELRKQRVQNQIANNNKRIAILQQKVKQGRATSPEKAEYNKLRNLNMQLSIQQKQLINNILQKGGSVPNVVDDNDGWDR